MGGADAQDAVIRPALPLLLFPLGGLAFGLFCAERLVWSGVVARPVTAMLVAAVLLVPGVVCVICLLRHARSFLARTLLSCVFAALCGLVFGMQFWVSSEARAQSVAVAVGEHPQTAYTLTILEDAKQGAISPASVAELTVEGAGRLKVRVFWDEGQKPLPLGTRLSARITFKPLSDTQSFLHQRGVLGSVTLKDVAVEGFPATPLGCIYAFREHNRSVLAAVGGEGSALLRGVLLGDTTELDSSEAGRAFKVTGLSHLVAVSGSHLVVIALLLSWLIRRLGFRRPVELALVTGLLVSYVFLTGLQPSAIRACVMTFIAGTALFVGRRGHIPSALAAAAVGMLLLFPPTVFSVGFWLSVYAVFGLTIFCPLVARWLGCLLPSPDRLLSTGEPPFVLKSRQARRLLRTAHRVLLDPLALTMTAQMATLPITAPLFATIALVSPLANLLVTPFITLLVGVGIVALCLLPLLGPLGPLLLNGLCAVADASIVIAEWCARLPFAGGAVALDLVVANACALLVAALIYRLWPQPSRRRMGIVVAAGALAAVLVSLASLFPVSPQVVMLDVGQGDAILVREGRVTVLIDTGESDAMLLRGLARHGVSRLDAVIVTHLDADHSGALDALVGTVSVGHVYFAAGLPEAQARSDALLAANAVLGGRAPEELARGDVVHLGGALELVMLLPEQRVAKGGNEESVCLGLSYDPDRDGIAQSRMLLTGDAEAPQLAGLLAAARSNAADAHGDRDGEADVLGTGGIRTAKPADATGAADGTNSAACEDGHPGAAARFDILKVGHHGSADAVTVSQLEQIGCRLALISAGRNNRYGHPAPDTLGVLEQAGVVVYRTDLNGDITLRFEGEKIVAHCDTMAGDNP
ncbi:MAG: ComEC/Rec2 family competence protein [Coriobacteriales bacterium]|jgi:competence protein ComEC|nr:ComEC/Rec2 family competence protein [Coriobacteriales bacterium]